MIGRLRDWRLKRCGGGFFGASGSLGQVARPSRGFLVGKKWRNGSRALLDSYIKSHFLPWFMVHLLHLQSPS